MKKKSFLSLVLAVVLMIPCMFFMTACGNGGGIDPKFANAIAIDKSFSAFAYDNFTHSEKIVNINTTDTYCFTFTKETDAGFHYIFGFAGYSEGGFEYEIVLKIVDEESCELYKSTDTSNKIDITDTYDVDNGVFLFEEDTVELENGTYYLLVKFTTVPDNDKAPDGIMAVVGMPS